MWIPSLLQLNQPCVGQLKFKSDLKEKLEVKYSTSVNKREEIYTCIK